MVSNPDCSIRRTTMTRLTMTLAFFVLCAASFGQAAKPETKTDTGNPSNSQSSSQPGAQTPAAPSPSDTKKSDQAAPTEQPAGPVDPAQAQLMADTAKLVKLTQELKAEVAKSNKDTLSLTVIKKADEVEKLAKSVKERLNKAH